MKTDWVPLHFGNLVEDKQSNAGTPKVTSKSRNWCSPLNVSLPSLRMMPVRSKGTPACPEGIKLSKIHHQRRELAKWHWSAVLYQEGISSFERNELETVPKQQQNFCWTQMEELLWMKHLCCHGAEPRVSWSWERPTARYLCSPLVIEVKKRHRAHQQNYCAGQLTSLKHFKWTKN